MWPLTTRSGVGVEADSERQRPRLEVFTDIPPVDKVEHIAVTNAAGSNHRLMSWMAVNVGSYGRRLKKGSKSSASRNPYGAAPHDP